MIRRLYPLLTIVSLALFFFGAGSVSVGQQAAGTWELGSKSFSNAARSAPPLTMRSVGRQSLGSYRFVGRVGGVSFEAVLVPDASLAGHPINLSYHADRPDGARLAVDIGGKVYWADLPDWQMKPIALFSDTEFTGVVSLFGEGEDHNRFYYIQYHEAMKDTLLGMRLLQADILLINLHEHWDLPRYDNRLLLGEGEARPDMQASMDAVSDLYDAMEGKSWQSWVLTDTDTRPSVVLSGDRFSVHAEPYYYFWSLSPGAEDIRQQKIQIFNNELDRYNAELVAHNANVNAYNASSSSSERERLDESLNRSEMLLNAMTARLEELQEEIENPAVVEVQALTAAMRANDSALARYNPAIHNAARVTAGYAAFFRYVKSEYSEAWKRFVERVRVIDVRPQVATPTTWER